MGEDDYHGSSLVVEGERVDSGIIEMCGSASQLLKVMLYDSGDLAADTKFRNRCRSHAATLLRRRLNGSARDVEELALLTRLTHRSDATSIVCDRWLISNQKPSVTKMLALVRRDFETPYAVFGLQAMARTAPSNTSAVWKHSNRTLTTEEIVAVTHPGIIRVLWNVPWPVLERSVAESLDTILAHIGQYFGRGHDDLLQDCLRAHPDRTVQPYVGTLSGLDVT